MSETFWRPDVIFVDEAVRTHPRTALILERFPKAERAPVQDVKAFARNGTPAARAFSKGKKGLFLSRQKGKFLSVCPAFTENAVCCHYRIINLLLGCNFDCSYCFLQAYLNNPFITFYVNVEDALEELRLLFKENPARGFRFGTGEFTDSLSLDHAVGLNKTLVEFFAGQANAALELKTKSTRVEPLLSLDHRGRTIIAWSLNTRFIQRTEEHKTASIEDRILAARRCVTAGYRVAFHFDPLIIHPDWEEGYRETINLIGAHIDREQIAWISYGALRFVPELKRAAQSRFAETPIFSDEFVKGFDGKMRYFAPLRTRLYQTIHRHVQEVFPALSPYLCMEAEHLWEKALGEKAPSTAELTARLDKTVGAG